MQLTWLHGLVAYLALYYAIMLTAAFNLDNPNHKFGMTVFMAASFLLALTEETPVLIFIGGGFMICGAFWAQMLLRAPRQPQLLLVPPQDAFQLLA